MFDKCQTIRNNNNSPKCTEVAEKIVQIFGWRQTYNVEKLQRNVPGRSTTRISITRPRSKADTNAEVNKGTDSWVVVHNLQSQGGGILDPDDRLNDVADDREQILASFEDGDGHHGHHGGGDGASGSSVGTGSPDLFHDGDHKYTPAYPRTDIEVTGEQIASGVPSLQVRRGSEPTLNQLPVGPPAPSQQTKRWSAAPLMLDPQGTTNIYPGSNDWLSESREDLDDDGSGFRRVSREGSNNRLSMQFFGEGVGYRWAEAAERAAMRPHQQHTSTSLPREIRRKEPLGQANTPPVFSSNQNPTEKSELIIIRNQPGPLGIHVVPDYDGTGKDRGLLVQGIEPGGRVDRDGRLAIFDRIVEINGQNLINMAFQRVQEMFKLSLTSPELRLKIIKAAGLESLRKPPTPIFPSFPEHNKENAMVECEQKQSTNTKVATVSPTKKVPAISKNLKGLLTTNTRKIGRKIEIELTKGPRGLGFSITTRDNPAGGNCPIYIKNIIPEGAAIEDGRLRIGDRLLQVNDEEMTGKSQAEAVAVLRKAPPGSKVKIVVSRQEEVPDNGLPRIIGIEQMQEDDSSNINKEDERYIQEDVPPNIPPLPQCHLQALHHNRSTPDKLNSSNLSNGSVAKIISQFQDATIISHPPDKPESSMVFPWKHRDILTFNIPVHDSEKAGLGISVKGKTSESGDLGIFIKSVINGGAASRDKRLRTNDQLLNVNGISLLQQTNSDAMETLRKAMLHTEGPVPGNITLTIARRASSPSNSRNRSNESLLNTSQELSSDSNSASIEHSNASGGSTNTVIYNPPRNNNSLELPNNSNINQQQLMHTWNPVLERLTAGQNKQQHQQQLRNESYYKATHDTWSNSMFAAGNSSFGNLTSTTLNVTMAEPILIEDEYGSRVVGQQSNPQQINVHMTNKMMESRNEHEPDGKSSISSNFDKNTESSSSQTTIVQAANGDVTYASQLSLENPKGFSRDAFGRQSMSEKRHATLDAKSTDTYQRTKKMREERTKDGSAKGNADKLGQLGPSLGMKKSSSLESLQTMVQEIQMKEECDPAYSYRGPAGALKVIRGRGCEESFRAAVVDPNHRSDIAAKKHWLIDGPVVEEREIDGFTNVRGAPRQSSLNAVLDGKHKAVKKKQGIFKGIGSMFRFGKHRKIDLPEPVQHYQQTNQEFDTNANVQQREEKDTNAHQGEQLRNSETSVSVQQQQHQNTGSERLQHDVVTNSSGQQMAHHQREAIYQRPPTQHMLHHGFVHRHAEQVQVIPENAVMPNPSSSNSSTSSASKVKYRQNSLEQKRNEMHRQRLNQRHTAYYQQQDEREPIYEQRHPSTQKMEHRDQPYAEYGRPGSRSGITESVPFTHYVNYNELQTHVMSRKQHQYHSQRQTRSENTQLRPMSNYYEYESVQSVLGAHRGGTSGRQPPINNSPQGNYYDTNLNAVQRQQLIQSSSSNNNRQIVNNNNNSNRQPQPHGRGPFVTQVTIGEHQKNGTKV